MSDILCAVCAEPWDQYGARHGDMTGWEYELFKRGAGCPCCEGEAPEGSDPDAALDGHLRSVVFNAEDPDSYPRLHGADRPKWVRPDDPEIWTCASNSCDVSVRRDLDSGDLYWHNTTGSPIDDPPETAPEHGLCPECVEKCDDCGEWITDGESFPDPRDPHQSTICHSCMEKVPTCEYCGEHADPEDRDTIEYAHRGCYISEARRRGSARRYQIVMFPDGQRGKVPAGRRLLDGWTVITRVNVPRNGG